MIATAPHFAAMGTADERIAAVGLVSSNMTGLIAGEKRVSFDELESDTGATAAVLSSRGIGAGDVVAVSSISCAEIVPMLRAIVRIGAIFVPLDPEHPKERIDRILKDSSARALIGLTCTLNSPT